MPLKWISVASSINRRRVLAFLLVALAALETARSYKYSPKQARCEPIEISICDSMRYNATRMPNSFGHSNQREAAEAIEEFLPLIRVGCSRLLRFFLCSRFVPICSEQEGESFVVPPCKSFCLQVKAGCAPVLAKLSFNWPPSLDCQNLPASSDTYNVCVEPPERDSHVGGVVKQSGIRFDFDQTPAKNHLGGRGGEGGMKEEEEEEEEAALKELDWLFGQMSKSSANSGCQSPRYVRVGSSKKKKKKSDGDGNSDSDVCLPRCQVDVLFSHGDKEFIKTWLTLWSVVSAVACALTVLSYLSGATELKYPEKPALYVAVCCAFESAAYAARLLVDGRLSHCSEDRRFLVSSDVSNWICTAFAVVLYYFNVAGVVWWVLLSFSWFLAAVRKWGQEAISSLGVFFHLIAWFAPGLAVSAVLATRSIEGDELLGICRVTSRRSSSVLLFSISPLALSLTVGGFFTFVGFVSVFRILKQLKVSSSVEDATRLERLIFRMGIFSVLYVATAAAQLACNVVKYASIDSWVRDSMHIPCLGAGRGGGGSGGGEAGDDEGRGEEENLSCRLENSVVPAELYLVQVFASLSIGITTTVWVWSRKTMANWGRLLGNFCSTLFRCKASSKDRKKTSAVSDNRMIAGGEFHNQKVASTQSNEMSLTTPVH